MMTFLLQTTGSQTHCPTFKKIIYIIYFCKNYMNLNRRCKKLENFLMRLENFLCKLPANCQLEIVDLCEAAAFFSVVLL
jgi:hypothetical protein